MNEIISNLNLGIIFSFSIISIVLIGLVVFERVKTKDPEVKELQKSFIYLLVLLEIIFIFSALSYIFKRSDYSMINLTAALSTLFLYLGILLRFWRFLDKKLVFSCLFFGLVSVGAIVGNLFFRSIFTSILLFASSIGLIVFIPLLIIKFLIDTSKEKMNNR